MEQKSIAKKLRGSLTLLLTALIWGSAFVAQSAGMEFVGPLTYNGVRTLIGGIVLIPVVFLFGSFSRAKKNKKLRLSVIGGAVCGVILAAASTLQQYGINETTVGKAGFITALYIVLVPVFGMFFGRKTTVITWICVAMATVGFYLLCVKENFNISRGDLLVLASSLFFSFHIMVIDRFNGKGCDGVIMSCVQFLTAGLLLLPFVFIFESPTVSQLLDAKLTILYGGLLSCGVGYTLQIIGQRDTEPAAATLIMSLESVFAALFGWLLLHETLSPKELVGCALVFIAVLGAQMRFERKKTGVPRP